jgi:hypothetical protein
VIIEAPRMVGLLAVAAVDRESFLSETPGRGRIWNKSLSVDREAVPPHAEAAAARDVELPGKGPEDKDGAYRLDTAVAVFEPAVHYGRRAARQGYPSREGTHRLSRYAGDLLDDFRPIAAYILR